jgi:hypothetical protein
LGDALDAAPHAGLAQGRTSDTKPASILRKGGQPSVSKGVVQTRLDNIEDADAGARSRSRLHSPPPATQK